MDGRAFRSFLALLLLVPAPSAAVWVALVAAPGPVGNAVYSVAKVWILILPLLWLKLVERAPLGFSPARRGGFLFGALSGAAMSLAIFGAHALLGARWIDAEAFRDRAAALGLADPLHYLGLAAYLILVNSVLEEYVWRWFVFRRLEDLVPGPLAVLGSAIFFTVHHTIALEAYFGCPVAILGSTGTLIGGAVWSYSYLRYRSVWPGYLSHAIVDVAVLLIGWRILGLTVLAADGPG